jgi:DNA-binding response OmpR family regulator
MKVLIAEDDRDFGNILTQYVTISGFEVNLAIDGKEAWEKFNAEKPDICVLDVMMPEMDGFTLAEKIKQSDADMPIIFLTAKSLKEDIVKGLKLGADDYITKPFDPEVLILRINNILKRVYSSVNDEYRVSSTVLRFNTLELICGKAKEKLTLKEAVLHHQ